MHMVMSGSEDDARSDTYVLFPSIGISVGDPSVY
jgi:hypothetical protein